MFCGHLTGDKPQVRTVAFGDLYINSDHHRCLPSDCHRLSYSSKLYISIIFALPSPPVLLHTTTMVQNSSRNPPITRIEDGLYLGDSISSRRRDILQDHNITAVVSLSDLRWVHWAQPWYKEIIHEGSHLFIPCNDSMTHDLLPELAGICNFIHSHRNSEPSNVSNVLVHCDKGVSRSATVLIAYLMRTYRWSFNVALAFVAEKRRIKPNENFKEQLQVWESVGYEICADSEGRIPKAEYAAYLTKRAKRLQERGLTGDEPIGIQSL